MNIKQISVFFGTFLCFTEFFRIGDAELELHPSVFEECCEKHSQEFNAFFPSDHRLG